MKYPHRLHGALAGLTAIAAASGCGGTGVGNPEISISSVPYGNTVSLFHRGFRLVERWFLALAYAAPVTELKFCVTQLKLTDANDQPVTQGGSAQIEAPLGLIDVSNPSVTTAWGNVAVPVGFQLKQLDIELHHDSQLCPGTAYSVAYNGASVTKDLELHFEFSPVVTVNDGDRLRVGLTNIAVALEQAYQAGNFTNEQISNYLTASVKGTGSE